MKKYIEKEKLFDCLDIKNALGGHYGISLTAINAIPAADVVEVVRCRECQYGEYDDAIEDEYCYHCRYGGFPYNKADHFCSDGERKRGG